MARSGRVQVDITADASGVKRGVRDAEGALSRLKGAGKIAGAGIGLGVAAAIPLIFKATEAASDLGEQVSKNGVVFAGAAADVEKWSQTTASSIGISQRAALEATGTFGNMLRPMGFAPQKAADMSKSMVQLAADMASFNNATPEDTLEAIRAGLAGEAEPLRKYGVLLSDAALRQEAMAQGLKVTTGALDPQVKAQATYALLLKQTTLQQGDFARTSGGMANQQRIARAEFENASAQLGKVFIPLATKALQGINTLIRWSVANWPRFRQAIADAFQNARAAAQPVIDWFVQNVVPNIRSIVRNAKAFWDRFGGDIKGTFRDAVAIVRPALLTIRSIIQTLLAVIRGDWGDAWKGLKGIVSNAFDGVVQIIKRVPARIATWAYNIGKTIGDKLIEGLGDLGTRILNKLPGGSSVWSYSGGDLVNDLLPGRAAGGTIPAPRGVGVPIIAHGGEVILNEAQQNALGPERIMSVLRMTGGVMGGRSFAAGGSPGMRGPVAEAWRRMTNPPRRDYVYGVWDCSDYAVNVAYGNPNRYYSTADAYPASKPAPSGGGDYTLVWGFRNNANNDTYNGGGDEHMGVGIIGSDGKRVWYDNGGGVASDADSARWEQWRVPPGWENMRGPGGQGTGGGGSGADTKTRTKGKGRPGPDPTKVGGLTRILRSIGFDPMKGADGAGAAARRILSAGSGDPSNAGLSDADERRIRSVGRAAGAAGGQEARDKAETAERMRILGGTDGTGGYIGKATAAIAKLKKQRATLTATMQKIGRSRNGTPASRRKAIAQIKAAIARINEDIDTWKALRVAWQDEYAELGYTPAPTIDDGTDEGGASSGPDGETPTAAAASADAQAQIDQANARATAAERNATGGAAWLRTLFSSGSIDPNAGSINVTFNTLHPGDPQIQGELARWVVGAFGGQGSVPSSSLSVA